MIATGVLFYAKSTKRFLFLLRKNTRTRHTWGMPGGKVNDGETIINGLNREIVEEVGMLPEVEKIIPLDTFASVDGGFEHYSFIYVIKDEFLPVLNSEHLGYCWTELDEDIFPKPLHPGLWNSVTSEVVMNKIKFVEQTFTS